MSDATRKSKAKKGRRTAVRAPEEMRKNLLSAATELFAERGLYGVSVQEIAQRAGASAAMINHHFGGKEALYRACLGDFAERRLAAVEKHLVQPRSKEDFCVRLELLVFELLELHLEQLPVVTILLRDLAVSEQWGPTLEQQLFLFSVRLGSFFEMAREQGIVRKEVDPQLAGNVLYLALQGFVQNAQHRSRVSEVAMEDRPERRVLVRKVLDVVLHGVLKTKD